MNFKSHLTFSKSQRGGILLLVLLIAGLISVLFFFDFSEENSLDTNSSELKLLQQQIDSLQIAEIQARKPKIYPFNPNFITDYKGYALGMSTEEIDRLKAFRAGDKWINSVSDFKNVTQVSDSLLNIISPYFKFPNWVTNPKPKQSDYKDFSKPKVYSGPKKDLNLATAEELMAVNGIGEGFSKRIITYREKLGGFSADIQLYNVYGLDAAVVQKVLDQFTVKTPKVIQKININKASASDIATVPGINFELAKKIWEYRKLHEGIKDFAELENIEGLTARKLVEIQLYLSLE